jgi:hypothetical protein
MRVASQNHPLDRITLLRKQRGVVVVVVVARQKAGKKVWEERGNERGGPDHEGDHSQWVAAKYHKRRDLNSLG